MALLFDDIRYALRSFVRRPGFTAVVLLTLALGIGSNVAIFSVANAVLFRPLPYKDPQSLVLVWNRLLSLGGDRALVSGPDFIDYRNEATLFEGFAGALAIAGTLTGEGPAEEVMTGWATDNLFKLLGVSPMLGRDFTEEDAVVFDPTIFTDPNAQAPPGAIILSYGLWQRRFGSDPRATGTTVQVDGQGSVIVGVLPRDFRIYLPEDAGMPTNVDIWRVLPSNFDEVARDAPWMTVVARLKPGVTLERAQQEMDALALRLRETYQEHANSDMHIVVNGMHDDVVSHARPVLLALLAAVGFVLVIACSNVANLLLVRASARSREIAVRATLGGGSGRIIRQMLTESVVQATAGGALGLLLAWWGIRLLAALSPGNLPRAETVSIDGSVLLFTAGAALLAAMLFGAIPALKAAGTNLADELKDRGSDSGGARGNKIRTGLVIAEVALSLVLLIGAGLMVRSFAKLQRVDPGFDPESVLTLSVPLPFFKYPGRDVRADVLNQLWDRVAALPGVESVGGVSPLPLSGGEQYSVSGYAPENATEEQWNANSANYRTVLPGYFETVGIPLVEGRLLERADFEAEAMSVVLVDEKLAERTWPGESPVGKQLGVLKWNVETFSLDRTLALVVGMVGDVHGESLASTGRETIYFPARFGPWLPMSLTVKGRGDASGLLPLIRDEVEALDPELPVSNVRFMESYVADAKAPTRFALTLIGLFAGMALVLASLGLYGVIAYSVRQRTREIGVRIAFGAHERDVMRLVVSHGLLVGLGGVALGLLGAFALTRLVSSLLVGVTATDPITFLGIPAVLLLVSMLASYVPARRAIRVDPVEALRGD